MSDSGKTSTDKAIHHGLSRIFMQSVKDLGHSRKGGPVRAAGSKKSKKSSSDSHSSSSAKALDDSHQEVIEKTEKELKTTSNKRGRKLNENFTGKPEIDSKDSRGKERRKSVVKTREGSGRLSNRGKPYNSDWRVKNPVNKSKPSLNNEKGTSPPPVTDIKDEGNIDKQEVNLDKNEVKEVISEVFDENWSLDIIDLSDALNVDADNELLKDSGCVSDFNNNRSSSKLFGSLSSDDSPIVLATNHGKFSNLVDVLEDGNGVKTKDTQVISRSGFKDVRKEGSDVNTKDTKVNSAEKDIVSPSIASNKKLCSNEFTDGACDLLPLHSTPKKHLAEEKLAKNKTAVSSVDSKSVILKGNNKLEMSDSRFKDNDESKDSHRHATKSRGGEQTELDSKSDSHRHATTSRGGEHDHKSDHRFYGKFSRPVDSHSSFTKHNVPPRFRSRERDAAVETCRHHIDYNRNEHWLPDQRYDRGLDAYRGCHHTHGYQSSRSNYSSHSNGPSEPHQRPAGANSLMDMRLKTPVKYKKTQPVTHPDRSKVNKIKWTLPVSEDWLSEIEEIETNDGKSSSVKSQSQQIGGNVNQNSGYVNNGRTGETDSHIGSSLASNSTDEKPLILKEGNNLQCDVTSTKSGMNSKPYIPPLPPGFDNDSVKINQTNEFGNCDRSTEKTDQQLLKDIQSDDVTTKTNGNIKPYIPPLPPGFDNDFIEIDQTRGNINCGRSTGKTGRYVGSTMASKSTEENQPLLKDCDVTTSTTKSSMNSESYIPPLPPGFDNDSVITDQSECNDTSNNIVNTSEKNDMRKVTEEKVPYLPPIPDEILNRYESCNERDQQHIGEGVRNVTDPIKIPEALAVDGEHDATNEDITKSKVVAVGRGHVTTKEDTKIPDAVAAPVDAEPASLPATITDAIHADKNVPDVTTEETSEKKVEDGEADWEFTLCVTEHDLLEKESEQASANQNEPLNVDIKRWKGTDALMTIYEDSSSVSSILKTEDPCAYSVFGGSTSEADVSDFCFDDSKILENLASQSSDGDVIQGVKSFENEIESGARDQWRDHMNCQQFNPLGYQQNARYWYEQQMADPAYQGSEKFQQVHPGYFGYEAYGQWYQNMWYEQMRYQREMYYRQYRDQPWPSDYQAYNQYNPADMSGRYKYKREPYGPTNVAESSKQCSKNADIEEKDRSGDSVSQTEPKLSQYWSNRMETWVQKQHSIAKHYQEGHIPVDSKSGNGVTEKSVKHDSARQINGTQFSGVEGTALREGNVQVLAETSTIPVGQDPDPEPKKTRPCSDVSRDKPEESVKSDADMKPESSDCCCKPLDVLYVVWRTCKCSAGNPPKVHQILPCNQEDRSLDLGYQSYESLEHDDTVVKGAARAPGFLIQPLNLCSTNKENLSKKSESTARADEETLRSKGEKLLSDQNRLRPPPGFVTGPYSVVTRNEAMDNSQAKGDSTEVNNNTVPSKPRQPLTLKELIKQQSLLELSVGGLTPMSVESYTPTDHENSNFDKNDNYKGMPSCVSASARHLDQAVKSMGNAEDIEKSLVKALRVVNERIMKIQENMSEQEKQDAINLDRCEKPGTGTAEMPKAVSKEDLDLRNHNVEHSGKEFGHNMNVDEAPNHVLYNKLYNVNEAENHKQNHVSVDKKLNYSPEDEAMTPPYEIPDNEIMETESKETMRPSDNYGDVDDKPPRLLHSPPSPFRTLPPTYRFPFRPPPFFSPRREYMSGEQMRTPPFPMPYQWPIPPSMCDPSMIRNPWSDMDIRNRPVGPYFDSYPYSEGHPRPRLSSSTVSEGPGVKKTAESKPQQKAARSLKNALKLIESYDSSDTDNNDDSPDIRPFDIQSINDSTKIEEQIKVDVEKPSHKKLKKDTGYEGSPDYGSESGSKMDTYSAAAKQHRPKKLKQKTLKTFKSTDRSAPVSSVSSDSGSKSLLKKKTLADIISEGRVSSSNRLDRRDDIEIPAYGSSVEKKLPDFPPLPPFPNSPFWCMYTPDKSSALTGRSPVETSPPKRASFGGFQQRRQSHDNHRYSVSPASGIYSPSETDSEKTSTRNNDRLKNFKLFHNFGVKYIDTHCHLDFLFNREGFKGTFQAYMDKHSDTFPDMFEGCVAVFCNPTTFKPSGGLWLEVAKESNVWIAMGCHPKMATDFSEAAEYGLEKCLAHEKCIALGEIGLDYSGSFRQHEKVQKQVFRCQLKMAVRLGKPLVIHSRDAEDDCIEILKEIVPRNWKIHCHCFTNAYSNALLWMDEFPNLFIGVTPLVTYRSATPAHDLARKIPLEKLLLETDAPYFTPRCIPREDLPLSNPGVAITVAKEIAKYQDIPVARVLRQCRLNTKAMYGV